MRLFLIKYTVWAKVIKYFWHKYKNLDEATEFYRNLDFIYLLFVNFSVVGSFLTIVGFYGVLWGKEEEKPKSETENFEMETDELNQQLGAKCNSKLQLSGQSNHKIHVSKYNFL